MVSNFKKGDLDFIFKKGIFMVNIVKNWNSFAQRGKIYHDIGWLTKHKHVISSLEAYV